MFKKVKELYVTAKMATKLTVYTVSEMTKTVAKKAKEVAPYVLTSAAIAAAVGVGITHKIMRKRAFRINSSFAIFGSAVYNLVGLDHPELFQEILDFYNECPHNSLKVGVEPLGEESDNTYTLFAAGDVYSGYGMNRQNVAG